MNYPRSTISLKNILLILGAVVIIGGSLIVSKRNTEKNKAAQLTYQAPLVATTSLITIEGDTTKDWEKELISTHTYDPKNPTVSFSTSTNAKDKKLTSTEILARTLFAKYMSLNQLGLGKDPQSQQDSINEVLAASLKDFNPPVYSDKQIKVSSDTSTDALKKYGNAVGETFLTNTVSARNETVILKEAVENNDPKVLAELDPTLASYRKMLVGLFAIPAPKNMAANHLAMINNVAGLIYLIENFKKAFTDPVMSLQAVGYYQQIAEGLGISFTNIRNTLMQGNVTYTITEGGSFFIAPQK
ncbi:MAG: hypothetical protein HZA80_00735 [Candidatus Taylorbacteria bacterium]|nr:hypothetical protein [Candidatus Taylorbacteria bacterium]